MHRNILDSYDVRSLEVAEAIAMTQFAQKKFDEARIMIEAIGTGYVQLVQSLRLSPDYPRSVYHEKIDQLAEIHKKIIANIPGVTGPQTSPPFFSRKQGVFATQHSHPQ